MSFKNQVLAELRRLAGATSAGDQPAPIRIDHANASFAIDLADIGRVGCSFHRVNYTSPALETASLESLKKTAEELQQRLSYLLESIRPIEIDEDGCVIQMRSNPPAADDDGTRYYELVVQRSGISLSRYRKQRGEPRQPVPAEVTHEVLGRLAEDLSSG